MEDEARVHAEVERDLHRLDGVVAAVRIAGDNRSRTCRRRCGGRRADTRSRPRRQKKTRLRPGTKVVGRPLCRDLDRDVAGERRIGDRAERPPVDQVILAEPRRPCRIERRDLVAQAAAAPSSSTACRWPYAKPTVSTRAKRCSAQARQTVESCPPENRTSAVSDEGPCPYLSLRAKRSNLVPRCRCPWVGIARPATGLAMTASVTHPNPARRPS